MTNLDPLQQKAEVIEANIVALKNEVGGLVVTDEVSQKKAVEAVSQVKARLKRIEELRLEFTKPLNDQVKKINNKFKALSEPLEEMEGQLKSAITKYMVEQERLAREEADRIAKQQAEEARKAREATEAAEKAAAELRRKAEEEAKSKAEKQRLLDQAAKVEEAAKEVEQAIIANPTEVVEAPKKTVRSDSGKATLKKTWTWKVTDEALLMACHPELFIVDTKAINKLVANGTRVIDGLEIFEQADLSVTA